MREIALYIITLLIPFISFAQNYNDAPVVSLITCDSGSEIYELEGHSGLRYRFPDGRDIIVNWGLFDFNSPNFVYRFVKGETDYRAGAVSAEYFLNAYKSQGRKITEQILNLTPEEALTACRLVEENLLPQNAVYRYNYVKDNCATRPVSIIERAVGETIPFRCREILSGDDVSFRDVMSYYHVNYPWYQFGIDLALGSGIDYPLSARERIFAPVLLLRMIDEVRLSDGRSLVSERRVLNQVPEGAVVAAPTPWYFTPMAVSLAILFLSVVLTMRDLKRKIVSRWFDTVLYSFFGIAGLLLTFLIFVSVHEATSPNWLYLWLNPFAFIAVICVWIKRLQSLVYCYQIINFVALIILLIIAACGVQHLNVAFYPLIISDLFRSMTYISISKCRVKNNC